MSILVNLDVMLVRRKMSLSALAETVGITLANLSILKSGKAKAVCFSTLASICQTWDCQPTDLLEHHLDPACLVKGRDDWRAFPIDMMRRMGVVPDRLHSYRALGPAGAAKRHACETGCSAG